MTAAPTADATTPLPSTPPSPPAHAVELPGNGTVTVAWSPATAAPGDVTAYDIAPIEGATPCADCRDANTVPASSSSIVLGSTSAGVSDYAVRSLGPSGASGWVVAQLPDQTPSNTASPAAPRTAGGLPASGASPWVASPVAGAYTSALDTAPTGYTRIVARDEGFSVPTADDGDIWLFGDTTVQDTPQPGNFAGQTSCFTRDGTAAVGTETMPPQLDEALQTATSSMVAQTALCTGDEADLPPNTSEPYQVLGTYPGLLPGVTCSNWVNGATNELDPSNHLTDTMLASYGSDCFTLSNVFTGTGGAWATSYQASSPNAQTITMPLGNQALPDLPTVSCPSDAFTSFDGGLLSSTTGVYSSALDDGGYYYFYAPYGDSTYAFAGLGIPEATCSAMALARVPVGNDIGGTPFAEEPSQYQYLEAGGQWQSPAGTGETQLQLANGSADIMPADYGGAYAGQVDVTQLDHGELAMVYMLPAPLGDPNGGTDVAAIRTATNPAGPWSAPQLFEIPSFAWGTDYQVVLHPELSTPDSLALSYVTVDDEGALTNRQVVFATLSSAQLPTPGAVPATGYDLVASDGGLFSFGQARYYGSMGGRPLNQPIVDMAATPDGGGYWEVARDGGIFAFGDAQFYGSMGGKFLFSPIVSIAAPRGGGYIEVAADGGIFAFRANFYGSMGGKHLDAPIVGITATPDGGGYWEVGSNSRVFAFGAARFDGPAGAPPSASPVVALDAAPQGGYWEASRTGGVFAYGAPFRGSAGAIRLNKPIVAMVATAAPNT